MQEHRFPCDNCGSDLRFDPNEGQLLCDHCGNTVSMLPADARSIRELDFEAALRNALAETEMEETRVSNCPNCAAMVEFDPDLHATECPFCATPVVIDTGAHRQIKPHAVLPFELDETRARDAMNDWLGRLWFAPGGLQKYAKKGRKLNGMYIPYWTYDADTATRYMGERGRIYYETRTVHRNGKRVQTRVARTRWTRVSGQVSRAFDDVLVLASRALPRSFTDAIAPWNLSDLTPYNPEYLAGFRAEGYTIVLPDGFETARDIMDRRISRDIRFDIGGDKQRIHDANTRISDITFKHVLLPVWMAAYKYRGKSYRFIVNGQTGAVKGERPYSTFKITLAVIAVALIAGAIGYYAAVTR